MTARKTNLLKKNCESDFKVGSLIKVIRDVLDKIREASEITQQVEVTNTPVQERALEVK